MKVFKRREIPHILASNTSAYIHLLLVLGYRIVPAALKITLDQSKFILSDTPITCLCIPNENWCLVAGGQYCELKRINIV